MSIIFDYKAIKHGVDKLNGLVDTGRRFDENGNREEAFLDHKSTIKCMEVLVADFTKLPAFSKAWHEITKLPAFSKAWHEIMIRDAEQIRVICSDVIVPIAK